MDLGATRFTTFRLVTLPNLGSALLAGALLAFALSFDEIVVTTFTSPPDIQTLPLWINTNMLGRSAGADRQRGGRSPDPAVGDPDLLLPEAVRRPDRSGGSDRSRNALSRPANTGQMRGHTLDLPVKSSSISRPVQGAS